MLKTIHAQSLEQLDIGAKELLTEFASRRVFAFYGEMGAGKTTFIKSICKQLNVVDTTSSPTFSIINEYRTGKGEKIYHFDFYRIKSEREAYDLGYEDYFYGAAYCFIEWPEKIQQLLTQDVVKITIRAEESGERIISYDR